MANKPNYIPEGYRAITPYLIVRGGAKAIDYYTKVFGAKELMRMDGPDGRVGHAELQIGDSHIMLADEHPEMKVVGPQTLGGSGVGILVYVPDVDRVFQQAVDAGAKVDRAVKISSMAIARGTSSIHLDISGRLRLTWKIFRPKR